MTSIIALQTVALVLLKKSDDSEYAERKVLGFENKYTSKVKTI